MILESDRLILRRPEAKDEAAAVRFWTSPAAEYVGGQPTRALAWRHIAYLMGHWALRGYGLWTVTHKGDDTAIGMVGPYYPEGWPEREIGWVLFDGAEGKGIAFDAASLAIADAQARLGWTSIVHYIAPGNHRSVKLAERLGARLDPKAAVPNPDKPILVYRQPEVIQ